MRHWRMGFLIGLAALTGWGIPALLPVAPAATALDGRLENSAAGTGEGSGSILAIPGGRAAEAAAIGANAAVPSGKEPEAAPGPAAGSSSDTPVPASPQASAGEAATPVSPEAGAGDADTETAGAASTAIDRQIGQWIEALSKEPGFENWAGSAWELYPLGPGTHTLLALVRTGEQNIGYMVVSLTPEGDYELTEYGVGSNPLFSMNTLYQSLVQQELISDTISYDSFASSPPVRLSRWYVPPLQAVWQVENEDGSGKRYFDAKTGEELPDIGEWLSSQAKKEAPTLAAPSAQAEDTVVESADWEAFDPFLSAVWLTDKPLPLHSFEEWRDAAGRLEGRITYSGKWYGGKAVYPLASGGYHLWKLKGPYIRLEHEGQRYVPLSGAVLSGAFYSNL